MRDSDNSKSNQDGGEKSTPVDMPNLNDFPVVGIGASAGGLEAIKELIENLDPKVQIACIVVQHLDPTQSSYLSEILSKLTTMKVVEAKEGAEIEIRHIYTIPPNTSLLVAGGRLRLTPRVAVESGGLFLPVNQLFQSLAESYGYRAIGIVLSGSGSDGTDGIQAIKAEGGTAFCQDTDTAKFDSMPYNACATGAVDFVLSPKAIAKQLERLVQHRYWLDASGTALPGESAAEDLKSIFQQVYKLQKIDFSNYKSSTVNRRILRRMAVKRVQTFTEYAKLIKVDGAEIKALCHDLLIQVTQFFRDSASFDLLRTKIFPSLVKDRSPGEPIRIWVGGCSSGQEVYSILMSLVEYLAEVDRDFPIQMFGTDINDAAITKARSGVYSEAAVSSLSNERLKRFFKKEGKEFEFSKALRESCIFAKHNLLTDPPFARLDLLSCQNVLIYFDTSLQKRVLPIFHYALKPSGYLLLGPAETVTVVPELFNQLKNSAPAYSKSPMASRLHFDFGGAQLIASKVTPPQALGLETDSVTVGFQIQRETDRICMAEFAPSGVVFNQKLEVIQFKGSTGPYFEHSSGFANLDLLQMLKGELVSEVRSAIWEVTKKGERVRKEGIQVRFNGHPHHVAIELFPVRVPSSSDPFFYLIFEDLDAASYIQTKNRRAAKKAAQGNLSEAEQMVALRSELASTKDYLQSINEQKEVSNEELRAANEEVMSSNEELQSTNEELHTAKEELQSTNEELMTVNDELRIRNHDLSRLNDDQNNLFTSLNVAVVMLNRELCIRKFTPVAETLLRLIPSDVGRSIADTRPNIDIKNLEHNLLDVIRTLTPMDLESQAFDGKWYTIQIRPYRTSDDKIDGAILIFSDITGIKRSTEYSEEIEEIIEEPLLFLTSDLKVLRANAKFYNLFQTKPKETEGRFLSDLGNGQWKIPELIDLLHDIIPKKTALKGFKLTFDFPAAGKKTFKLNGHLLRHHEAEAETILLRLQILA